MSVGHLDKTGVAQDTVDHQSPFWSAVLVVSGRGEYRDDRGHCHPLRAGSLLYRFPDRHHWVTLDPTVPYHEVFLVPGPSILAALESFGLITRDQPVVQVEPDRPWLIWCMDLFARLEAATPDVLGVIALDMGRGLAELLTEHRRDDADRSFARCAVRELTHDPTAREPLGAVAARLGLSEDTFRKRFKQACGTSAGQFRIRNRLNRACALLSHGNRTIAEVADVLGYPSAPAFTVQFVRFMGCPPSRWQGRRIG